MEMLFRKKYLQVLFYWLLVSGKVGGRLNNDVEEYNIIFFLTYNLTVNSTEA